MLRSLCIPGKKKRNKWELERNCPTGDPKKALAEMCDTHVRKNGPIMRESQADQAGMRYDRICWNDSKNTELEARLFVVLDAAALGRLVQSS